MDEPRVWATSEDGSIEYVSITKDLLPKAIKAMQKSFYLNENVCVAFDMPNQPESFREMDGLLRRAAVDGVSIAAVNKATGEVVGAAFNKLEEPEQSIFYLEYAKCLEHPASIGVAVWMADIDNKFDIFKYTGVKSLLEIMFLGIVPEFRKRGIAKKLFEVSIELSRQLKAGNNVKTSLDKRKLELESPPEIVTGIFTSLVTQKIAKDLNFKLAAKIDFNEFIYDGISLGTLIGNHTPYLTYEYFQL